MTLLQFVHAKLDVLRVGGTVYPPWVEDCFSSMTDYAPLAENCDYPGVDVTVLQRLFADNFNRVLFKRFRSSPELDAALRNGEAHISANQYLESSTNVANHFPSSIIAQLQPVFVVHESSNYRSKSIFHHGQDSVDMIVLSALIVFFLSFSLTETLSQHYDAMAFCASIHRFMLKFRLVNILNCILIALMLELVASITAINLALPIHSHPPFQTAAQLAELISQQHYQVLVASHGVKDAFCFLTSYDRGGEGCPFNTSMPETWRQFDHAYKQQPYIVLDGDNITSNLQVFFNTQRSVLLDFASHEETIRQLARSFGEKVLFVYDHTLPQQSLHYHYGRHLNSTIHYVLEASINEISYSQAIHTGEASRVIKTGLSNDQWKVISEMRDPIIKTNRALSLRQINEIFYLLVWGAIGGFFLIFCEYISKKHVILKEWSSNASAEIVETFLHKLVDSVRQKNWMKNFRRDPLLNQLRIIDVPHDPWVHACFATTLGYSPLPLEEECDPGFDVELVKELFGHVFNEIVFKKATNKSDMIEQLRLGEADMTASLHFADSYITVDGVEFSAPVVRLSPVFIIDEGLRSRRQAKSIFNNSEILPVWYKVAIVAVFLGFFSLARLYQRNFSSGSGCFSYFTRLISHFNVAYAFMSVFLAIDLGLIASLAAITFALPVKVHPPFSNALQLYDLVYREGFEVIAYTKHVKSTFCYIFPSEEWNCSMEVGPELEESVNKAYEVRPYTVYPDQSLVIAMENFFSNRSNVLVAFQTELEPIERLAHYLDKRIETIADHTLPVKPLVFLYSEKINNLARYHLQSRLISVSYVAKAYQNVEVKLKLNELGPEHQAELHKLRLRGGGALTNHKLSMTQIYEIFYILYLGSAVGFVVLLVEWYMKKDRWRVIRDTHVPDFLLDIGDVITRL